MAATWSPRGTDVNFGFLTEQMVAYLQTKGVEVRYGYQVTNPEPRVERLLAG